MQTKATSQYKEYAHGLSPRELAVKTAQFGRNERFFTACDTGIDCGRYLHRQFFETRTKSDPDRPWVFDAGRHMADQPGWLAHNTYPQPNGENWFADFAVMLAHATPNFISWMWCDGSYPSGHFEEMQHFTLAYRQLPLGLYETVKRDKGLFVRSSETAFYVVEIDGDERDCELPDALASEAYRDVVTGEQIRRGENGRARVSVRPYGFRVFVK